MRHLEGRWVEPAGCQVTGWVGMTFGWFRFMSSRWTLSCLQLEVFLGGLMTISPWAASSWYFPWHTWHGQRLGGLEGEYGHIFISRFLTTAWTALFFVAVELRISSSHRILVGVQAGISFFFFREGVQHEWRFYFPWMESQKNRLRTAPETRRMRWDGTSARVLSHVRAKLYRVYATKIGNGYLDSGYTGCLLCLMVPGICREDKSWTGCLVAVDGSEKVKGWSLRREHPWYQARIPG